MASTTVTCDLGRHQSCRKVVLTLTTGLGSPLSDCACSCHQEQAQDEIQDLLLERSLEDDHFSEGWS
jgi:hypothetical protein